MLTREALMRGPAAMEQEQEGEGEEEEEVASLHSYE